MTTPDSMDMARQLVLRMLPATAPPTRELIGEKVGMVVGMLRGSDSAAVIDEDKLVREIEAACNVWVPDATSLVNNEDHIEWLADRRSEISWNFWERYRRYLEDVKQLPPESVRRLHGVTDDVLKRLEDPERPGQWDRRGMVVGQVQSGKTANYTGLICKAADAGYRLIIVLAGAHNSLRSQTQLRLDEGFLGFDTQQRMLFNQNNARLGVGLLPGEGFFHVHPLTSSEDRGDFQLKVARQANVMVGGRDPVLLVVKKNASILRNLLRWATLVQQQHSPEAGRDVVRDVPLLVIDDEADYASVNTRAIPLDENGSPLEEEDPTRINGRIRELLHRFEQSAYIGYTATPFANIFISPEVESDRFGQDLFPRDFIVNLPVPSDYVGPVEVFGLRNSPDPEDATGMPVIRPVVDYERWLPDRHKKDQEPGPLPQSLRKAIHSFVLVCAARAARGQRHEHNSMLVHVTRFVLVQRKVTEQVKDELEGIQRRLRYGDGNAPEQLLEELRTIWEQDFQTTTEKFDDPDLPVLSWERLLPELSPAADRVQVLEINGSARDALQYFEHPRGLSCIAIGGDKLSRGLTLEGLSVSYYLRASRMYDTLMQMGRWFGYRPGYADLCRLYTTPELAGWYKDITMASEELRQEFDYMAAIGGTPKQFGLLVRKHPDGLMVTAAAKMRHGLTMQISFSGSISETIVFHRDSRTIEDNFRRVEYLLESLGEPETSEGPGGSVQWHADNPEPILTFLDTFVTHDDSRKARATLLARYIRNRKAAGELVEWDVRLASGAEERPLVDVGGQQVRLVKRARFPQIDSFAAGDPYRIRRLVSPTDETRDLGPEEYERALELTRRERLASSNRSEEGQNPRIPSGTAIRRIRPPRRGLLLLYPLDPEFAGVDDVPAIMGFAISFPESKGAPSVEYVVNNVYWNQEFGGE